MVRFAADPATNGDVLYASDGALGRIRLNRPRALNALNLAMVVSMQAQLDMWATEDSIATVAIDGAGERGLCAGGDVRAIRQSVIDDGPSSAIEFWAAEYRLNATIASYPKPFVSFMDGVTMGGGVGISAFGSLRLTTPRSTVAMPETGIGFFPDVGGSYLLSRAPGELGAHLALSGLPVDGPGAVVCGLADACIEVADFEKICRDLAEGATADSLHFDEVAAASILNDRQWIDECYRGDDASAIVVALQEHASPEAANASKVITARSPLSVAVALEALRRAKDMTLTQVLDQDARLGKAFLIESDFLEGVRAVLVDKDHAPSWRHAELREVDRTIVCRMFELRGPIR